MAEPLTNVDLLLLDRWADTTGIRDAIKELEERLANRLNAVAERLRPWLEAKGFVLLDVETKYAAVNVGKAGWVKNKEEVWVYITIAALFPFGYRRVEEEHPHVWIRSDGLSRSEQEAFQTEVSNRFKNRPGEWLNEECSRDWPAGRYIKTHGDVERSRLAQSEDAMEAFMKAELEPLLALGDDVDAALRAARGVKPSKARG